MIEKLKEFLKKETSLEFGFCPFSAIENSLIECAAKKRIPKGAKTVISFLFPYKCEDKSPLNISRYAAVEDYHQICDEMLDKIKHKLMAEFKNNCFEYFVDNSPIPEVKAAALSKLGVVGKNNLLITPKWGSFVFLGEIITDIGDKFPPTILNYCLNCNKCIEKCPTGHLKNKEIACLSDITQKKKITKEEEKVIASNGCVWGCDICQEVCPLNLEKSITNIAEFKKSYRDKYEFNEENKNRAYNWRGTEVIKRNYEILSKSKQS